MRLHHSVFAISTAALLAITAPAQLEMQATLATRSESGMTFDSQQGKTVIFGGRAVSGATLQDTWTRYGGSWSASSATGAPSLRAHGMTYVPPSASSIGVLLVFGGILPTGSFSTSVTASGVAGATWTFSGNNWSEVIMPLAPSPRRDPLMCYDPSRAIVVLHGGRSPTNALLSDTWTWSPTAGWAQVFGAPPPVASSRGLAYDPQTMRVTLVVGNPMSLYSFDGSSWTFLQTHSYSFFYSDDYAVATAPNGAGVLIFGGHGGGSVHNGLCLWDGTSSSLVAQGAVRPGGRMRPRASLDASRNRLIVHGGLTDANSMQFVPCNDTWEWDGSQWHYSASASYPEYREDCGLVATPGRGGLFLEGGDTGPSFTAIRNDTWTFMQGAWQLRGPGLSQVGNCIAYDLHRDRVVRFDGTTTWEHDGSAWVQVSSAAPRPSARGPMVFDPGSGHCVLFNGQTWEWDGVAWQQRITVVSPPGTPIGLAYHARRQEIVLLTWMTSLANTWVYTGQDWLPRGHGGFDQYWSASGVTYDQSRDRVIVLASMSPGLQRLQTPRVFEWDGVTWDAGTALNFQVQGTTPALAYSPDLSASLLVCGSDTWILGSQYPGSFTSMGPACQAPAVGVPILASLASGPWIGNNFDLTISGYAPGSTPLFGVFGFSSTNWNSMPLPWDLTGVGMPSCVGQTSVDIVEYLGSPTWTIPIPYAQSFVGMPAHVQALVLSPGANPLGALATNGGSLQIGRR